MGINNPANWINTTKDAGEFSQLIGHANNLGINTLWFFIGDDGGHPANVPSFADAAWRNGWLKKYERKYYRMYRCDCAEGCFSLPPDDGCWSENNIQQTSTTREVYP